MHLVSRKKITSTQLRFPKKDTIHCLLDPKKSLIQHWPTICSDPSILTFTLLFSTGVNWEEENNGCNRTWDHGEELYGYNKSGMSFHLGRKEKKERIRLLTSSRSSRPYTSSKRAIKPTLWTHYTGRSNHMLGPIKQPEREGTYQVEYL